MKKQFSEEVRARIGHYVYRLIDPRNGETFYVGKGTGNRVFDHANGDSISSKDPDDGQDEESEKLSRIKEIKNAQLDVLHVIHRHDIPQEAVDEVEAALIDAYEGLSNVQGGRGSGARGPMNHAQIEDKYNLPELEHSPEEKLILISIPAIEDRSNRDMVLDQVRYAWRINIERAMKADYVLAVVRGVVIGAFKPVEWLPATLENFSDVSRAVGDRDGRYGFRGFIASDEVWLRFVGARGKLVVNQNMKHNQNPIRYWNL